MPSLVQRRTRHVDVRVPRDVPGRRGAAMTSGRLRDGGARIDRSRPLRFTFDGESFDAFDGDTLASALLANGATGGFTSPILGRPRGFFSAGVEEPNAFVEIGEPWF